MKQDMSALALVTSDGNVEWIPAAKLRTRCLAAETEPGSRKEQDWICTLKLGSWVHSDQTVDIDFWDENHKVDISGYVKTLEIVGNSASKEVKKYDCCEGKFPDLEFQLKLKEA